MKKFDVLVIGGGSGLHVAYLASLTGTVGLVEEAAMGGTCENWGCVPTKTLLYSADVADAISNASKYGILVDGFRVDFKRVMERMRNVVNEGVGATENWINSENSINGIRGHARFVSDRTIQVGEETYFGDKVFICAGSRPAVPPVEGLSEVGYLDDRRLLKMDKQPNSILIIGGGFIGVEFAHFFSSLGTKVTIVQGRNKLIPAEDQEVSELITKIYHEKANLIFGYRASKVTKRNGMKIITLKSSEGDIKEVEAEEILVAAGRKPNSDLLDLEKTGVSVNEKGFITVNDYFQTGNPSIWASGDIIGKAMFKHTTDEEAKAAWRNSIGERTKIPYHLNPHAVFSSPPIGSIGLTEDQARKQGRSIIVSKKEYRSIRKGATMGYPEGFAKAIVEKDSKKIIGFHIIGPNAPEVLHEVVITLNYGDGTVDSLLKAIHVHPTIPELVKYVFETLE